MRATGHQDRPLQLPGEGPLLWHKELEKGVLRTQRCPAEATVNTEKCGFSTFSSCQNIIIIKRRVLSFAGKLSAQRKAEPAHSHPAVPWEEGNEASDNPLPWNLHTTTQSLHSQARSHGSLGYAQPPAPSRCSRNTGKGQ